MRKPAILILFFFLYAESRSEDSCGAAKSCGECVAADPGCGWCSSESYLGVRCDRMENLTEKCPASELWSPNNRMVRSDVRKCADPVDRWRPHEIHLQLRPGSPYRMTLDYRRVDAPPLDLYVLADGKGSGGRLGNDLHRTLRALVAIGAELTPGFNAGLGWLTDNSTARGEEGAVYFRNHLPLSEEVDLVTRLAENVEPTEMPEGPSNPEAVWEALCREEVGWRNHSVKILVFYSHRELSPFGSGRRRSACLADSEDGKTNPPSGQRLSRLWKEQRTTLVFVTRPERRPSYLRTGRQLGGQPAVFVITYLSQLTLVLGQIFRNAEFEVRLKEETHQNVRVSYYSRCLGEKLLKTNRCTGVKAHQCVTFEVEVEAEAESCPKDPEDWNRELIVFEEGSKAPVVRMSLETLCQCECEKPENQEISSPKCEERGTYQCGVCLCDHRSFGKMCECDAGNFPGETNSCVLPNGNGSNLECSGRGMCICGVCQCILRRNPEERIYGKYCECDDFDCPKVNGLLCNGPDRGRCVCGRCACSSQWIGEACECSTDVSTCLAPDGKICSGRGECVCGTCRCHQGSQDPFCGHSSDLRSKCDRLAICVSCLSRAESPECRECRYVDLIAIQTIEEENPCQLVGEDGCRTRFTYDLTDRGTVVYYQRSPDCPSPSHFLWIAAATESILFSAAAVLQWILV